MFLQACKDWTYYTTMELQLGLALPVPIDNPIKGHDQIKQGTEAKQMEDCFESRNCTKRKRSSFEDQANIPQNENQLSPTLPLLSWNDRPRDEDDEEEPKRRHFCTIKKKDEENDQIVGWPPIKSWRKKAFHRRQQGAQMIMMENCRRRVADSHGNNSMFVKVKMEGVAIARKLDLRVYHSHHSLRTALIAMFAAYETSEKDGWDLTLIYEDKEGDWLLAEDLPWNSFVKSAQRLKLLVRKRNKG